MNWRFFLGDPEVRRQAGGWLAWPDYVAVAVAAAAALSQDKVLEGV